MALIFSANNSVFTNSIENVLLPTEGLEARFDFGVNRASSTSNMVVGGSNLTPMLGDAGLVTYTTNAARFLTYPSSSEFFRYKKNGEDFKRLSVCMRVTDGNFERLMTGLNDPRYSGLKRVTGGDIVYSTPEGSSITTGTQFTVSSTYVPTYPYVVVATIEELPASNQVRVTITVSDDIETVSNSETFTGSLITSNYDLDIGRFGVIEGHFAEISDVLVYDRAITKDDTNSLIKFVKNKYL